LITQKLRAVVLEHPARHLKKGLLMRNVPILAPVVEADEAALAFWLRVPRSDIRRNGGRVREYNRKRLPQILHEALRGLRGLIRDRRSAGHEVTALCACRSELNKLIRRKPKSAIDVRALAYDAACLAGRIEWWQAGDD
jgi:hypothetical protein